MFEHPVYHWFQNRDNPVHTTLQGRNKVPITGGASSLFILPTSETYIGSHIPLLDPQFPRPCSMSTLQEFDVFLPISIFFKFSNVPKPQIPYCVTKYIQNWPTKCFSKLLWRKNLKWFQKMGENTIVVMVSNTIFFFCIYF